MSKVGAYGKNSSVSHFPILSSCFSLLANHLASLQSDTAFRKTWDQDEYLNKAKEKDKEQQDYAKEVEEAVAHG